MWKHQPWIVTYRRISDLTKALIFSLKWSTRMLDILLVIFEDNSCSFTKRDVSFFLGFWVFDLTPETARGRRSEWPLICAVYMYVDITDLPNKQRTSNLVQIGNALRKPISHCATGATGQDGLDTRLRKTKAQVKSKDMEHSNWERESVIAFLLKLLSWQTCLTDDVIWPSIT